MKIDRILQARKDISPYIIKTPLERCHKLEEWLGSPCRIFLKRDDLQITNTFKVRGAFNALLSLTPEQKKRGVTTRSSGNFAQAVACAAEKLKIPAIIVMPENAPKIKQKLTSSFHPELIFCGNSHEEGEAAVNQLVKDRGLTPFSPYNHLDVIAGQGVAALEILEELPTIANLFCPIGGGGLLGGCALAFKEIKPDVYIFGIEPEGAKDYFISRQLGKRTIFEKIDTIADGLRAPQVGEYNWPLLQKYVDTVELVSELEIKKAMKWLKDNLQLIIEPSGATALAALLFHPHELKGDTVCHITGANVDPEMFEVWIKEAEEEG